MPREDYVPDAARSVAYMDRAVPLGDGSVLAPALSHGQMLIAAEPVMTDRVLVIGKPGALSRRAGQPSGGRRDRQPRPMATGMPVRRIR